MADLAKVLAFTFAQEGGYQNDSADNGNWTGGRVGVGRQIGTNHGISAATLAHWHAGPVGPADMMGLTLADATAIAAALFANPLRVHDLPAGVDLMVFEQGWGAGVRQGALALQAALGVAQDGFIGPQTLTAAHQVDPDQLIEDIDLAARARLQTLSSFQVFGRGWIARADRRLAAAIAMAASAP